MDDYYSSKHVDSILTQRLCDAMKHNHEIDGPSSPRSDDIIGIAQPLYITKGNHSLSYRRSRIGCRRQSNVTTSHHGTMS
jgi:hypothetical protein